MAFRLHALIALLDAVLGLANGTSNASNASSWRVGAVCEGSTNIAQTMLQGKHLRVMDVVYHPFAKIDATQPYGWSGFDIDLLERL